MDRTTLNQIELQARERVEAGIPGVELLACEDAGSERLRLVIDRDGGVDLDLCEQVTRLFDDLLEEYTLEVSSPGPERPLRTSEHFQQAVGHRVRVRTLEPISGTRNFLGILSSVGEGELVLQTEQGSEIEVPMDEVARAHLAPSSGLDDQAGPEQPQDQQSEVTA